MKRYVNSNLIAFKTMKIFFIGWEISIECGDSLPHSRGSHGEPHGERGRREHSHSRSVPPGEKRFSPTLLPVKDISRILALLGWVPARNGIFRPTVFLRNCSSDATLNNQCSLKQLWFFLNFLNIF